MTKRRSKMKRISSILILSLLVLAAVFSNGAQESAVKPAEQASKELTLYYSHAADWTDPIIKEFQDRTGIRVNLVGAGTGELVSRIKAEKDNPLADVLWGGGSDSYQSIIDLLQPYEHAEMNNVYEETRDPGNRWHGTSIDPMVIIYNTNLVSEENAPKGWADLLNPAFSGSIAHADPARSGSAFMALIIQLEAMGGDNETGWKYMKDFVTNMKGKLLGSSSGTFKGVSDGEYAVGITYEEAALRYQRSGANLKVVYPIEGTAKVPSPIAIIKNCKNLENAQKFVDFILSKDVQEKLGDLNRRSVRKDVVLPSVMVSNDNLGDIPYDTVWVGENKDRILKQWKSLIVSVQ
jgi:iron(III) transport system substrate-binding protein